MELKGIWIDKRTGRLKIEPKNKYKWFPSWKDLFIIEKYPEIILTKEEAIEKGIDINDSDKYFTKIDNWRVPINIKKEM